jgi:hypothetical protein
MKAEALDLALDPLAMTRPADAKRPAKVRRPKAVG